MKRVMFTVAVAALFSASCYSPTIASKQFTCSSDHPKCPSGFVCWCDTACVKPSEVNMSCPDDDLHKPVEDLTATSVDMEISIDQSTPADLVKPDLFSLADLRPIDIPCTNGGARSDRDQGLLDFALCPAAWLVAGSSNVASTATPCDRHPTANGMDASGHNCSIEDNCALGWHVCRQENDLSNHGFTATACLAVDDADAFWLSRQDGGPPQPASGPPDCNVTPARTVFGCGKYGNVAGSSCAILHRVLVDGPTSGDDCSTATNGAFTCTSAGPGSPENTVIQKPALAHGGVMCCRGL